MADKFIHVNKKTVKNGDTVYLGREAKFLYVGEHPERDESAVIMSPSGYLTHELYSNLEVKSPKKTVWVNLVKYGLCGIESSVFACEKIAKRMASKYAGDYLGTFPIEIDDVA